MLTKQFFPTRRSRGLMALAASIVLGLPAAASAQAAVVSTGLCDNATLTQPFAQWGDSSSYKLAPGGDFSNGAAGWTLSGGATTVVGSASFSLPGASGNSSLYLPQGATARSTTTCVDASYPTMRMSYTGSANSIVQISVVYQNPSGGWTSIPVGTLKPGQTWAPTPVLTTMSAVPSALTGGVTQMAIQFRSITGSAKIDDVFVDPRMRN